MNQRDDSDIQADWSDAEMSVLRSAELDAPPRGAVERTLTAIGVGAALGTGVGTASSLTGAAKLGSRVAHGSVWLKWLATVVVGGGIASAVFLHRQHRSNTPTPPPAAPVALATPTPEAPEPESVAAPTQRAADAPSRAALAPSSAALAATSAALAPSHAENKADLAAEIRLIDEARDRLRRGDTVGSLATLAAYDQLVKRGGSMRAEATVVRIEAYQKSGDLARAAALGSRFVAQNPGSPYAEYVKRILSHAN